MTTRLAELDRLKAEFMSVASHEIKTPLNVIKGYASLLHDGIYGSVSDEQQKALASVIGQTDHLTRLVKRLLDISRLEAGSGGMDFRAIEFPHWVSELAAGFEVLAHQSNANFAVEMDGPLPQTIVGDPDRLAEVVGNLMSNACKLTPPEGPIRLRVAAQPGEVLLEVVDSGVGIPADKLPRIFEKFFQVDNEAQPRSAGSGLGLAIAREIVEGHGGTISASSKPGRGTTFRVVLPEQPPGAPAALQLSTNQTTT
jgi:signal transduction histidine kinase